MFLVLTRRHSLAKRYLALILPIPSSGAGAAVEVYPTEHSEGVAVCPPSKAGIRADDAVAGRGEEMNRLALRHHPGRPAPKKIKKISSGLNLLLK